MDKKQHLSQETRQRLLTAAGKVVLNQGVARLTLDSVAKEAGVSKGGLLYHFPTKESLISGLLEYYIWGFEESIKNTLAAELDGKEGVPGRLLSAYIRASAEEDPEELTIGLGLLAAIATNPALLDSWRVFYKSWQDRIMADGIDPVLATIARLAADGLWVNELFGIAPLDPTLRQQIIQRLLFIAKGSGNRSGNP